MTQAGGTRSRVAAGLGKAYPFLRAMLVATSASFPAAIQAASGMEAA